MTTEKRIDSELNLLLLLLLLSHFSRVRLCATPQTAAHQASLSLGFSRQEHWSGLPFLSPMNKRKRKSEVAQSCTTLSDPMDCSLPGSSVHGIFQARVLEWDAIAFSELNLASAIRGSVVCQLLSLIRPFATPRTVACLAPVSVEFSSFLLQLLGERMQI